MKDGSTVHAWHPRRAHHSPARHQHIEHGLGRLGVLHDLEAQARAALGAVRHEQARHEALRRVLVLGAALAILRTRSLVGCVSARQVQEKSLVCLSLPASMSPGEASLGRTNASDCGRVRPAQGPQKWACRPATAGAEHGVVGVGPRATRHQVPHLLLYCWRCKAGGFGGLHLLLPVRKAIRTQGESARMQY